MSELKTITVGGITYTLPEGAPVFIGEQADWNALTAQEKAVYSEENGGIVIITNDYEVQAKIDDTTPSLSSVYSSQKTQTELNKKVSWSDASRSVKKNLLNSTKFETSEKNGLTPTINSDGSITISGTHSLSSGTTSFRCYGNTIKAGTYIYSLEENAMADCLIMLNDSPTALGNYKSLGYIRSGNKYVEFTITDNDLNTYPYLVVEIGIRYTFTSVNTTFYPMVRLASILDDTYTPYIPDNVELQEQIDGKLEESANNVLGAKNLLPNTFSDYSNYGIDITVADDGSLTVDGTCTTSFSIKTECNYMLLKAGTYVLSLGNDISSITSGNGSFNLRGKPVGGSDSTFVSFNFNTDNSKQFTIDSDYLIRDAYFNINSGLVFDETVFYPMIRLATDMDSTYQPHAETNLQLTQNKLSYRDNSILGAKNFARCDATTKTVGEVTFTLNSDNSITASASGATSAVRNLTYTNQQTFKAGSYIFNGCPSGGGIYTNPATYGVELYNITDDVRIGFDIGEGLSFTLTSEKVLSIVISIRSGYNLSGNSKTFKPMIRLASDTDDTYVPYAKTNKELTNGYNKLLVNTDRPPRSTIFILGNTTKLTVTIPITVSNSYQRQNIKIWGHNNQKYIFSIASIELNQPNTSVSYSELKNLNNQEVTMSTSIENSILTVEFNNIPAYACLNIECFSNVRDENNWTFS